MLLFILLILLALFGMPLFTVLGSIALAAFHGADINISSVAISMYMLASSPLLVAIPLFTFAGYLFANSGTPDRLVRLSRSLFPGGLAVVALMTCAVFTAFTGASGVTIVAMGGLLFPALLKDGYNRRFSLGLVTTSGSLGLLFPPSLPLILYERLPDGGKRRATDHPLFDVLHRRPNRWQTAMQFFSQMQGLCMLHGDAYAEIVPGPRSGFRDELIPLNPTKLKTEQLSTGRLRYIFIRDDGTRRTLNQDQVFHVPGFGTNGITGYSLVKQFKETAGLALATEQYGANFFGRSAIPPVVL
ncbi:MAG: phage portal protein, partial [Candidatus Krumholzibacteriota bacterium]|nr:phage portal protein [Candidatus Krumholzibacteriota bacterium]